MDVDPTVNGQTPDGLHMLPELDQALWHARAHGMAYKDIAAALHGANSPRTPLVLPMLRTRYARLLKQPLKRRDRHHLPHSRIHAPDHQPYPEHLLRDHDLARACTAFFRFVPLSDHPAVRFAKEAYLQDLFRLQAAGSPLPLLDADWNHIAKVATEEPDTGFAATTLHLLGNHPNGRGIEHALEFARTRLGTSEAFQRPFPTPRNAPPIELPPPVSPEPRRTCHKLADLLHESTNGTTPTTRAAGAHLILLSLTDRTMWGSLTALLDALRTSVRYLTQPDHDNYRASIYTFKALSGVLKHVLTSARANTVYANRFTAVSSELRKHDYYGLLAPYIIRFHQDTGLRNTVEDALKVLSAFLQTSPTPTASRGHQ